jgi:anaerobic selenocysteine-containing dehydrogenase
MSDTYSPTAELVQERVIRSICWSCSAACGVLVHVKDGVIRKIEGDPQHPRTKGSLCSKGLATLQMQYHPQRLTYPMKRIGERGAGQWQRISWQEALDTIASKLRQIRQESGPEAVAVISGGSKPVLSHSRRFANALGTPNHGSVPHICSRPYGGVARSVIGSPLEYDIANAKCIVCVGSNWLHTQWAQHCYAVEFMTAKKNGAHIITIDPRFSMTADHSTHWLQVRPGTDGALLLAWLSVIINEGLYDKEFVENWTTGFPELKEHTLPFTPEWAAEITWLEADKIRETARIYATTNPACITVGVGLEQTLATQGALHALCALAAITGNVDVQGGNIIEVSPFPVHARTDLAGSSLLPREVKKPLSAIPLIPGAMAGHAVWNAILTGQPYPIQAVLVHGGNPLVSNEDARQLVFAALQIVDFLVVMDIFPTPTAEMADILLPAATWLEKDDLNHRRALVSASPKIVEPVGEAKDDREVFIEILKRLGLTYGAGSVREILDRLLSSIGLNYDQMKEKGYLVHPFEEEKYVKGLLRSDGERGFNTSSGKIELYCDHFAQLGLSPLPHYQEPPESPYSTPELCQEYPLILTNGGRRPNYLHTQFRQLSWLRRLAPEPEIDIHPETATSLGICNGDWVMVEGTHGRFSQKARLTHGIHPKVVHAEFGWWFPEESASEGQLHGAWKANVNVLTKHVPQDPACGSTPLRAMLCKVYKAEGVAPSDRQTEG